MERRFGSYSVVATLLGLLVGGCAASQNSAAGAASPAAPIGSAAAAPATPPPTANAAVASPETAPASAACAPSPAPLSPATPQSAQTGPATAQAAPVAPQTAAPGWSVRPAAPPTPAAAPTTEAAPQAANPSDGAPMPKSGAPEVPVMVSIVDEPPHLLPKLGSHGKKPNHSPTAHHTKNSKQPTTHTHAEPHIAVDVAANDGQPLLERAARSHEAEFRGCYDVGLRRDQEMAGKLEVELGLTPDGHVDHAKLTSTTLGDPNVEMCLVREASAFLYPVGPVGGTAPRTMSLHMNLQPGEQPVATNTPMAHADQIVDDLQKVRPEIEQCYRDGVGRKPLLGGPLSLKFKVRPSGEVFELGETETHFGDIDTTRCITHAYRVNKLSPIHAKGATKKDISFVYTLHLEADSAPLNARTN